MKKIDEPIKKAMETLKNYDLKTYPVTNDILIDIMNNFGIEYYEVPMKDEVSGLIEVKNGVKRIIINEEHHINRKRFTTCHEIGHYILHYSNKDLLHIDERDYRRKQGNVITVPKEVEANRFAGALLMPEELVDERIKELFHLNEDELVSQLAQDFKVSKAAMIVRLQVLGYFLLN